MARPLRIEFEDVIYHVMARGNVRQKICLEDAGYAKSEGSNLAPWTILTTSISSVDSR